MLLHFCRFHFILFCLIAPKMSLSTHPLLSLLECNATGLKSMLTHYIDATVDSQFASLRNSFETMIQSGVIGPNCDGTHFGMTLPQPTQTNTHQSSAQCLDECSNDTLTREQRHQNNLQNEVSNTINTDPMIKQEFDDEEEIDDEGGEKIDDEGMIHENVNCPLSLSPSNDSIKSEIDSECEDNFTDNNNLPGESQFDHQNNQQNEVSLSNIINTDNQMIKQKFDDDEEDGEEIEDDNVAECENGICNSVRKNYDDTCGDTETRENGDEHFETNVHDALENIQTNQSIISNDILPNQNNPINTEEFIKKECFQVSSITSIPLDFANNAALNDISIDEKIDGQIQTDEFDDNGDVDDDDYYKNGEGEYLNNLNCEVCHNAVCDLNHENINNHLNSDVPVLVEDETNFDKAQSQINVSVTNNTQMNNQNDNNEKCERNMEQSTPSTSGVRSSIRKRIQTKVFGDLVQSNGNTHNSAKRKSYQVNESGKKAKRKRILDDDGDTNSDDQEFHDHATSAIEEQIATECTTNPVQPNLAQPNRRLQCSHCLKLFYRKSNLEQHLRVHTGERPFPCDQCDKRFKQQDSLAKHRLIHQNIKRFQCVQCDKQFTQKVHLENHQRTHSGERPYQCRFCDKSFAGLGNRNTHEQAKHLHVKPYRCKQCGHTATRFSDIIKHVRVVHFGLPRTTKEQHALNIIDGRDPRELIEKV